MTTLPALRTPAPLKPRLERLEFADRERGLTRRHFILACLGMAASQVVRLLDRLEQLPLLAFAFPETVSGLERRAQEATPWGRAKKLIGAAFAASAFGTTGKTPETRRRFGANETGASIDRQPVFQA